MLVMRILALCSNKERYITKMNSSIIMAHFTIKDSAGMNESEPPSFEKSIQISTLPYYSYYCCSVQYTYCIQICNRCSISVGYLGD